MPLLPTQSSEEALPPLSPACGFFPPLPLSTEPSSEISASIPGTYFLQIIVYALYHSALHFHAGLMVQSAHDDKDVTFYHLKSPGASEPIRRDPKPLRQSRYKLIPVPISICEWQLSRLHHLLTTTKIIPYNQSGPKWLQLPLARLENVGFLPEYMGVLCYSRMCSAIQEYASRRGGAPWDALRGKVKADVLDGPTQVVVIKRPLADGVDHYGKFVRLYRKLAI